MMRNVSIGLLLSAAAVLVLCMGGCSCDGGGEGDGEQDLEVEDAGPDGQEDLEVAPDPAEDPDADDAGDPAAEPDAAEDLSGDEPIEDVEEEEGPYDPDACTMPPEIPVDPVDPEQTRFALQMLHFNIQYVAGGLEGFCPFYCDYNEQETEDLIIRESFVPILDFYLLRPTWKVDIELPSYMIEVMAERFPDDLHKLQILTWRGQVSLISFHYSAQFFLAFPTYDQERSWEKKGEFGEGRHAFMQTHGYDIGVFPKNLYKYYRGDVPYVWPYYSLRGTDVVVGPIGVDPASGIEVAWPFFDDGEKLAVAADLDPYFGDLFRFEPARMIEYAEQLQALEDAGYKITTIEDYVRHLKARGLDQPDVGPVLDGTWQPSSTDGVHRWLGGMGQVPWSVNERDNEVRTANVRGRTLLQAADLLIDYTEAALGADYSAYRASMSEAWRHLLFAEVSDATGINPWAGEIDYSLSHTAEAEFIADYVITELKSDLGAPYVAVDLLTGDVQELDELPVPEEPPVTAPPLAVDISAERRTSTVTWYHTGFWDGTERYQLVLSVSEASGTGSQGRIIRVSFPRTHDRIVYSPGLLETELVDYGMDEFVFQEGKHFLPLPNGIIGLGGGWWAIKHTDTVHVAALVTEGSSMIDFEDETQPVGEATTWVFEVFQGSAEDALALANRINVWPLVTR